MPRVQISPKGRILDKINNIHNKRVKDLESKKKLDKYYRILNQKNPIDTEDYIED